MKSLQLNPLWQLTQAGRQPANEGALFWLQGGGKTTDGLLPLSLTQGLRPLDLALTLAAENLSPIYPEEIVREMGEECTKITVAKQPACPSARDWLNRSWSDIGNGSFKNPLKPSCICRYGKMSRASCEMKGADYKPVYMEVHGGMPFSEKIIFIVLLSISVSNLAIRPSPNFKPIDSWCFQTHLARPISPSLLGNS
ncbi:hypothetical protein VULLAG_LOCUS811 [Vulpes lagopus]